MSASVPKDNSSLSMIPTSKAMAAFAAYEGASKLYSSTRTFWQDHFAYTVTVSERDILYPDIHDWLLSIVPNEKHRSLMVASGDGRQGHEEPDIPDGAEQVIRPLTVRFNDKAARKVVIDNFPVSVTLQIPEASASQFQEPEATTIQFVARSYDGQQAVIRHLNRINAERSQGRKAVLRMVNQWGSWRTRSDLPPRTLESVSLPMPQKSRIVEDLRGFLNAEEQYNRLAIPWHRGYMFYGPPGTGKTSLVKALANYFNLDLWYISLADLKAESSLLGLLAEVGPRSLLLLEDIDTMRITQDRDGSEQGTISMSSLLNTLDGVATPHGLITVMTTNRFDVLDSALTRAGRMDLIEELGYPNSETLAALYQHFYGRLPRWHDIRSEPISGVSAAQMAEVFKHHMSDPVAAEAAAETLIKTSP